MIKVTSELSRLGLDDTENNSTIEINDTLEIVNDTLDSPTNDSPVTKVFSKSTNKCIVYETGDEVSFNEKPLSSQNANNSNNQVKFCNTD
jgi:hypothetical protein